MPKFYDLKVEAIKRETSKAVSIHFAVPDSLKTEYEFIAGQYITLKTQLNGKEIRRDYSLCTNPRSQAIKVVVKEVENGLFSPYANKEIRVGTELQVGPPQGRFTFVPNPQGKRIIMAIAAGSGITPVMSILITLLEEEPNSSFVLLYGNKSPEDTIFLKELDAMKESYNDRFTYIRAYSQTHVPGALFGRIDRSFILHTLNQLGEGASIDCFYLCGPKPLIDESKEVLTNQGYGHEKIKYELFSSPEIEDSNESSSKSAEGKAEIEIIVDDETFSIEMEQGETILEAALSNDIDAPYSCQGGICSSCIARIKEGTAEMRQNNILTDSELAEGLVLTCQAEPRSGKLVVDYDDV